MEKIIGTITKSDSTVARVSLSEFKGNKYINIREWYTKDHKQWFPGKGIAFLTTKVSELVSLIEKAESEIMAGATNGQS